MTVPVAHALQQIRKCVATCRASDYRDLNQYRRPKFAVTLGLPIVRVRYGYNCLVLADNCDQACSDRGGEERVDSVV